MHAANPVLSPIFFFLFIFLVVFVLFNMFLAIVNQAYFTVKELYGRAGLDMTLSTYLYMVYNRTVDDPPAVAVVRVLSFLCTPGRRANKSCEGDTSPFPPCPSPLSSPFFSFLLSLLSSPLPSLPPVPLEVGPFCD